MTREEFDDLLKIVNLIPTLGASGDKQQLYYLRAVEDFISRHIATDTNRVEQAKGDELARLVIQRVKSRLGQRWRGMLFRFIHSNKQTERDPRVAYQCVIDGWAINERDASEMHCVLRENVFKNLHENVTNVEELNDPVVFLDGLYKKRMAFIVTIDPEVRGEV